MLPKSVFRVQFGDMEPVKDGWFFEFSPEYPGQAFGLKIKKILFEGKSDFQKILLFERFAPFCFSA